MPAPRDASTIIVARDSDAGIEVYLLRRSSRAPALPDAYVFPGGTLAHSDKSPQARMRLAGQWLTDEPAFTYAAIRETYEECGLLFSVEPIPQDALRAARTRMLKHERSFNETLLDLNARLDAEAIHYFSRWITPAVNPHRFDARFLWRARRTVRSPNPTRSRPTTAVGFGPSTRSRRPSATKFR